MHLLFPRARKEMNQLQPWLLAFSLIIWLDYLKLKHCTQNAINNLITKRMFNQGNKLPEAVDYSNNIRGSTSCHRPTAEYQF